MSTPLVALTVAGTDSGGAAGVAADLATFADHGHHGALAVSALTAQDTTAVRAVHVPPLAFLAAQVDAVLGDLPVAAVKTGMLGSPGAVRLVAERLAARPGRPLVVDPVLVATSGAVLGDRDVAAAYRDLLPHASVVTPNLDEARALLGLDPSDATPPALLAADLADRGCAVVLTGGPAPGAAPDRCIDHVAVPGRPATRAVHPWVDTRNDHGSGCTFAAALAARLAGGPARPGHHDPADLVAAVEDAASYTAARLERSRAWRLGAGRGPVAHTSAPTHPGGDR
ncbi:hydroxymethylpyrimidine/phosphomethylpyrimidine kinase [Nocardioides zeae]|uniref:Hydroxymethylpyrimidine/phosphomethylpyrimidine kinase n=1 Tax=Nocardioides imazamoxiresistens TaxID=3231893 RepID=A0ABU3PYW4_9ACTN|nr:hydroxymethylpyrimidine/phosphomethylpyrimidine kinase [Nocardioides zeae]MDT9594452.1 hydroxymethylpyrimidine/phosphomethylpyrimidine kinase [Nocardioides zeae]